MENSAIFRVGRIVINSRSISVNRNVIPFVEDMARRSDELCIKVTTSDCGAPILDAGIDVLGGIEVGRIIAEICMGGLGKVSCRSHLSCIPGEWPLHIDVRSSHPVLACLASQYAGWSLKHKEEGTTQFSALGSGPARALALREELFVHLDYSDDHDHAVIVLETSAFPPDDLIRCVAEHCRVDYPNLYVILTPTQSLAGSFQVAARVLEVGLHRAHSLEFKLDDIVEGVGTTPFPPPGKDALVAMGRTNDVILFCGYVHLFVTGKIEDAMELTAALPSCRSKDFGTPFSEIFISYKYDFFAIDPALFSPAMVTVTHLPSGESFTHGKLRPDLLSKSFISTRLEAPPKY